MSAKNDAGLTGTQGDDKSRELSTTNPVRECFGWLLLIFVSLCKSIGNRPLAPDEARYVEIAREMIADGDYISPRLNGLKYFEKPPLFYWIESTFIKCFGVDEFYVRLPVVIFAILGILSVYLVSLRRYEPTGSRSRVVGTDREGIGIFSSWILATSLIYYIHSRLVILDLALSVFLCGSLWCFYMAFVADIERSSSEKKYLILGMYGLSALACMTKGLIGAVLPGLVAFLWLAITKSWSKLKEILYIPGILLFLAIFLPWHVVMCIRNPEFFDFYFIHEHVIRYTTLEHQRFQPFWYFIPIAILGMFPWTGFSLVALKNSLQNVFSKKKQSEDVFFLSWIFGILMFYSFSHSKLIPYILPIFPPIAYLTAKLICETPEMHFPLNPKLTDKNFRQGVWCSAIFFAILLVAFFFAKGSIEAILQNPDMISILHSFGIMFVASIAILVICTIYKIYNFAPALFCLSAVFMMLIINSAIPYYQDVKKPSTKAFAELIRMNLNKDDEVFCYKKYCQDLPAYLNRKIKIVDFYGELKFGYDLEPNSGVIVAEEDFWNLWSAKNKRIFLLLTRNDYKSAFAEKSNLHNILNFDRNFILISNK